MWGLAGLILVAVLPRQWARDKRNENIAPRFTGRECCGKTDNNAGEKRAILQIAGVLFIHRSLVLWAFYAWCQDRKVCYSAG